MFLGPTGDTLFYKRRVEGLDALFAFQPDSAKIEVHAQLASSRDQIRAWATTSGQVVVCDDWPRSIGGLRFKFYDARNVARLLEKKSDKLTDVPTLGGFKTEQQALPVEIFEGVRGEQLVYPGLAPIHDGRQTPALYEVDGVNASYRCVPLGFLAPDALPGRLFDEPGGKRRWLTVGDSNHLFVIDAKTHELVDDVIWPTEHAALARVAFHPTRPQAWISALGSVFVYDRETLTQVAEVPIESDLRWHRGERVRGFIGGVVFSQDGERALVARPLSGDLLEVSISDFGTLSNLPLVIDPLELCAAPGFGRVYAQSLRNGAVSWLPYR